MIPTKTMKSKLAFMNQRNPDGSLFGRDHLLRRPLVVETAEEVSSCFNSGGAGCYARPQDYCRASYLPYFFFMMAELCD